MRADDELHDGRHGRDDDVGRGAGVAPDRRRARPRRGGAGQISAVRARQMTVAVRWLTLGIAAAMSLQALSLFAAEEPTKADPGDPALVARGKAAYDQHCASCHGAKLEGQPNWRKPPCPDLARIEPGARRDYVSSPGDPRAVENFPRSPRWRWRRSRSTTSTQPRKAAFT